MEGYGEYNRRLCGDDRSQMYGVDWNVRPGTRRTTGTYMPVMEQKPGTKIQGGRAVTGAAKTCLMSDSQASPPSHDVKPGGPRSLRQRHACG